MAEPPVTDHRQATAARNVAAILDAAERILAERRPATMSAIAAEAGVSRVTLYSHFPDRKQLLGAVVERAVGRWISATEQIDLAAGAADEVLRRVLEKGWEEISHSSGIAAVAAGELDPEALKRSYDRGQGMIRRLVERGRREGTFRTDVPTQWLVTSFFALIHAAHAEVTAGRLRPRAAREALLRTVPDLFRGG